MTTEDGFSLIELMVVLAISAILLAVGIPTYLGAQHRGANASVASNLTAAAGVAANVAPGPAAFRLPAADPATYATYAAALTATAGSDTPRLAFLSSRAGGVSTGPTVISEWRGPTRAGTLQTSTGVLVGAIPGHPGPYGLELSALSSAGQCDHLVIDFHVGGWTALTLGLPGPGVWWTATSGPCTALTEPPSMLPIKPPTKELTWHRHAANAAVLVDRRAS